MVSFPRIIDMGDFQLVKLEPTAQNAENKLTEMGFADMGLQRIQLTLDKQNIRSAAVALRCGYECEGVLRKYFILRGQPRDMKMFSRVAE